jgi:hypothetical protein
MTSPYRAVPYRPFSGYIPYQDTVSTNPGLKNKNGTFDPLSAELDLYWSGGKTTGDPRFSNYYDYFFSGEDVRVYIDGLFDPKDELDIAGFGFLIKQEKQAVYGFWSYNFDAMMNGSRIITGQFSLYSRYPRRMTHLLEEAARVRSSSASGKSDNSGVVSVLRSQNESRTDEENIQKYWANSQLDRITTDPAISTSSADGQHNIFSAHPPFNFVIVYGVEESSLSPVGVAENASTAAMEQRDNLDRIISTDINERKVKMSDNKTPMKIVLQNVHLMQMSTEYQSGGSPLIETYSFVARDFYLTEAESGFNPYTGKTFVSTEPQATNATKPVVESPLVNRTESTQPR